MNGYYVLQGSYVPGEWEDILTEETKKEAYDQLRCYNENEPNVFHRVVYRKKREEIANG